jgi:uncharacterized protein (TIGR02284 family)
VIPPDAFPEPSDAIDLQLVLMHYVDSQEGYQQAAELMDRPQLAEAFSEVSARRGEVAERIAELIELKGERAEAAGSAEGAVHRWWMRLREKVADEELQAVLSECIRGEKVLLASLEKALTSGGLSPQEATVLQEAAAEVQLAVTHFEEALER